MGLILLFIAINEKPNKLATLMMKHDKEHPLNSSSETLNYPMGNFRQYRYAKRALKFAF